MTLALVWAGTILLIGVLLWRRFPEALKKRKLAAETAGKTAVTPAPAAPPLGGALFDALTKPFTLACWALIGGGAWWYSPQIFKAPNWVWVPVIAWALTALFSSAKSASREGDPRGGKEKKPHPSLETAVKYLERAAILSTIAVALWYGFFAPAGSWEKISGKRSADAVRWPDKMVIPKGIPLNPVFTSRKLEGWTATYIAANIHYGVPQSRWRGQRLSLSEKPARELTDVADLTVGFGQGNETLDIRLSGSCCKHGDNDCPLPASVSKACLGDWKDRGSQISGKFYLQVKESGGGNRYFDAYLYDGNNIPQKSWLEMILSGPVIPHIMLQFRPKQWTAENQ
ncbi:MAG: hypothetical protein A3D65_05735 [Candidatus Lloydbacteria bacterium RIFCSPHIGHO2_02_FULL_50_13]|uniref:Uncharacterized protein n=1 Tax=Candidatus Lloydbacteria bacterium RIFCSPHIGHO2_02_FULL_50_13 TaxID=1798661 RepID=A0A1G2D4G0_9BACT|nr:MAG: hypothetical protein A3D65_05735 [Candidatus Lloydbacteria bacterium RIFCSPHIGHO2_02_FULL_50_13]